MRYVVLHKDIGETPLEALARWKTEHTEYRDVPTSYAGRLDPMASGKLLVLLGDECKKQTHYTGLDKEYEVEVLFDVGSDTGDVLGVVSYTGTDTNISLSNVRKVLKAEQGTYERTYPAFSSKTVAGKPLFLYALEKKLNTISIPTHNESIYKIRLVSLTPISSALLQERVKVLLSRTPKSDEPSKASGADFRIAEVKESWKSVFTDTERSFFILKLRVICGSGTYMRSLASRIGEKLLTKALALSIHRTKIGRYWGGMWWKRYR